MHNGWRAQSLQGARTLCYFLGLCFAALEETEAQGRGERRWPPWVLPMGKRCLESTGMLSSQNKGAECKSTLAGFAQSSWAGHKGLARKLTFIVRFSSVSFLGQMSEINCSTPQPNHNSPAAEGKTGMGVGEINKED